MKKFSKIVLALLVVACVGFSVFALTACGEAGPQGLQGEAGPQGPQGATGATGADGASAWEMYQAWYLEEYGTAYEGTEADWYYSIINQEVHSCAEYYQGNYYAELGTAVATYQKCAEHGIGNIVFVEGATAGEIAVTTASTDITFAIGDGVGYYFFELTVDSASDGKYFTIGGTYGRGAALQGMQISIDGMVKNNPISLTEGTYRVVVKYGNHLDATTLPANVKLTIEELATITNTDIAQYGDDWYAADPVMTANGKLELDENNSAIVSDFVGYYFQAEEAGVYKITCDTEWCSLFANWDDYNGFVDFQMTDSYVFSIAEDAILNFFVGAADGTATLTIEKIA